jgi:hypothetical protein
VNRPALAVQASQIETRVRQEKSREEKAEEGGEGQDRRTTGTGPVLSGRQPNHTEAFGQALNIKA